MLAAAATAASESNSLRPTGRRHCERRFLMWSPDDGCTGRATASRMDAGVVLSTQVRDPPIGGSLPYPASYELLLRYLYASEFLRFLSDNQREAWRRSAGP